LPNLVIGLLKPGFPPAVPFTIVGTHFFNVDVEQSEVGCVVTAMHSLERCFRSTEVARLSVWLDRALRGGRVVDGSLFQRVSGCLLSSQLCHDLPCIQRSAH